LAALGSVDAGHQSSVKKPRLVLFITVDQGRYEYFERFRPAFKGGLKKLLDRGVVFTDARQNHATTATAPGHASLSTGLYPARSGLIANDWFDRETGEEMYSVEDWRSPILRPRGSSSSHESSSSSGRSPRNILGTALADWMKEANPKSKTFAAGGKDRSAIPMGGKNADGAYWYDRRTGEWVTSRYYMHSYPTWALEFHEREIPDSYFGRAWEPLPVAASVYDELGIEELDRGVYHWRLPHPLGGPGTTPGRGFYQEFYESPYMDWYLMEFAKAIIEGESLGTGARPDFLALCFSSVDLVGHAYGPNSPEILDTFLRLDLALADLFEYLDERIGMQNVAAALSADHGVMTLPEYLGIQDQQGERFTTEDVLCFQGVEGKLDARFGEDDWLLEDLYINYEALGRKNLRRQEVEDELGRQLKQCSPVQEVWTRTQLESADPGNKGEYFERFLHSFHPDRSADLMIQLKRNRSSRLFMGTTHGTPYEYDSHVPMILSFPGIPPAVVSERVNTIDFAPTLASLLGIPTPENLDGVVRGVRTEAQAPASKD
jgi:predicted AlkP superfamily pyrophosphatase or phosphodiesterase